MAIRNLVMGEAALMKRAGLFVRPLLPNGCLVAVFAVSHLLFLAIEADEALHKFLPNDFHIDDTVEESPEEWIRREYMGTGGTASGGGEDEWRLKRISQLARKSTTLLV